jgi:hypothetical protein
LLPQQPSRRHTAQHTVATVTHPWISNMRSSLRWCHSMSGHVHKSLLPETLPVMCGQHYAVACRNLMQPLYALLLHAAAAHVLAHVQFGYVLAFARHHAWAKRQVPGCTRCAAITQADCSAHAPRRHAAAPLRPFTKTIISRGTSIQLKQHIVTDPRRFTSTAVQAHLLLLLQCPLP